LVINGRAATGKAIFNAVCALSEDEQEAEGLPEELPPEQRKFDESQAGEEYPMSLSPMQTARPGMQEVGQEQLEGLSEAMGPLGAAYGAPAITEGSPAAVETAPAGYIRVRYKPTGQLCDIPADKFDPSIWEKVEPE